MALITLKRFPTAAEIELCNLTSNLSAALDLLAETFPKPRVQGAVLGGGEEVCVDNLCFPIDWFHVTHLSDEDKKDLAREPNPNTNLLAYFSKLSHVLGS